MGELCPNPTVWEGFSLFAASLRGVQTVRVRVRGRQFAPSGAKQTDGKLLKFCRRKCK